LSSDFLGRADNRSCAASCGFLTMNTHQFVSMLLGTSRRWTVLGLTLFVALSCHDATTAPRSDRLAPPDSPSRDASPGAMQGPVHIPIAATNEVGWGTLAWTPTGMTVPPWTSYVVRVSGRTTVSSNPQALQCNPGSMPPYGAEGTYGPAGDRYYYLRVAAGWMSSGGVGNIAMSYDGVGTTGGDEAHSDTLFTWDGGQIAVSRSGIQGSSNGTNPWGCLAYFYALTSAQTISLETFDGQGLSITPSWVAVRNGTSVSFRATSGGALVNTPHWRFDADSGVANQTGACGMSGPNPCLVTVQNSGTLRVATYVQGQMRAAAARVKVYSTFDLTADPADVVRGDTVTFTPLLNNTADKAAHWLWRGDDSSVVVAPCVAEESPCRYAPRASGTMWAYTAVTGGDSASAPVIVRPPTLELAASKATLSAPGENDTFTATGHGPTQIQGWNFTPDSIGGPPPFVAVGGAWGNCSSSDSTCTNLVSRSGTVSVIGTVRGVQLIDTVHVAVVPPRLTLEADSIAVWSGATVSFTLKYDGAVTPADHWNWVPDSVGAETSACANGVAICKKQVTGSGVMWATLGQDSASARVVLKTTLGGCGDATLSGSPTAAHQSGTASSTSIAVPQQTGADCVPDPDPSGPDTLLIDCHRTGVTSGVPIRGESVSCNTRLRSSKKFVLTATASGIGNVSGADSWTIGFSTVDSTFYASVGTAAITTKIIGVATRLEDSAVLQSTTTFAVASRATTPVALTRPQAVYADPTTLSTAAPLNGVLIFGKYPPYIYDYENTAPAPPIQTIHAGPDSGLAFIAVLPDTAPGGVVLINQALTGVGSWASDQADTTSHVDTAPTPYYSSRWCRPADFPHLLDITTVHEGSDGNGLPPLAAYPNRPGTSHYDIRRRAIAEHLAGLLEALVIDEKEAPDRARVWNRINNVFSTVQWDIAVPVDRQFDNIEDSMFVLYSDARFACQDYLSWTGGKQ
jgi:hypothetical protein